MNTTKTNVKQSLLQKPKFTTVMFLLGALVTLVYFLLGAFKFTDDAYVVQISTPVAPRVSGVVQQVHVANGDKVSVGEALVSLDPTSYEHDLAAAIAEYERALVALDADIKSINVAEHNLTAAIAMLDTLKLQLRAKDHPSVRSGVSKIDISELINKIKAQTSEVDSLKVQVEIDRLHVLMQEKQVQSLKASMQIADTALRHTTVVAPVAGVVENVFLGIGTHVSPAGGMFTLINDGVTYVQANYEETELAGIKAGDKATIYPRIYLGEKTFEGVVVANPFGVSRQTSNPFTGEPFVATENKWLLLPQRLPVIIQITESDDKYPLVNGMSTYVRLHD